MGRMSPEVASFSGARYAQGKQNQECMREKTLLASRPYICAARDRPVAQPRSHMPCRALEHAGRLLTSAFLHPGPRN